MKHVLIALFGLILLTSCGEINSLKQECKDKGGRWVFAPGTINSDFCVDIPEPVSYECEPEHEGYATSKEYCTEAPQINLSDEWHGINANSGRMTFTVTGIGGVDLPSAKILWLVEGKDGAGGKVNFHFFLKMFFARLFSHHFPADGTRSGVFAGDQYQDYKPGNIYRFDITWTGKNVMCIITENNQHFQTHELNMKSAMTSLIHVAVGKHAYSSHNAGVDIMVKSLRFSVK